MADRDVTMTGKAKELYDQNIEDFGNLDPHQVLGLTIYGEARGENRLGRIAVGTCILERVKHRSWDGDNVVDVCLWPYQFSCFNPSDPNRRRLKRFADDWQYCYGMDRELYSCVNIAKGLLAGVIPPDPDIARTGACNYLTPAAKKNVDWWQKMKFVKKIGGHEFYYA